MGLAHAVVTAVARDDLPDGGAAAIGETVRAIRRRDAAPPPSRSSSPTARATPTALAAIFDARPDVLNHNLETVARLQRVVRPVGRRTPAAWPSWPGPGPPASPPSRASSSGMGETEDEVLAAMADLRNVGVDILTVGQYLRPSADHLPVDRWWTPEEFDRVREAGAALGFAHVEASPLTRSSYHARQAAEAAR